MRIGKFIIRNRGQNVNKKRLWVIGEEKYKGKSKKVKGKSKKRASTRLGVKKNTKVKGKR